MLLRDWPRSHQAAVVVLFVFQLPNTLTIGETAAGTVGALLGGALMSLLIVAVVRAVAHVARTATAAG